MLILYNSNYEQPTNGDDVEIFEKIHKKYQRYYYTSLGLIASGAIFILIFLLLFFKPKNNNNAPTNY